MPQWFGVDAALGWRLYKRQKEGSILPNELKDWEAFGTMRADQKIPISLMGICVLYRRDPLDPSAALTFTRFRLAACLPRLYGG